MGSCCGKASDSGLTHAAFRTDIKNPLLDPSTEIKDAKYVVITLSQMDNIRYESSTSQVNSFVEMKLLPSNVSEQAQLQYSSVRPSTSQPKWEPPEQFNFVASNLQTAKLIISARSFAPPKHNDLGDTAFKLSEIAGSSAPVAKTLHFKNPNTGKSQGTVDICISVLSKSEFFSVQTHIVFEFERWVRKWGHEFLPTDPAGRWCSQDGKKFGPDADSVAPSVPDGYVITEQWSTTSTSSDADGWQYSTDFTYEFWYPENSGASMFVRRRSWHRKIQLASTISSIPSSSAQSTPSAAVPSSPLPSTASTATANSATAASTTSTTTTTTTPTTAAAAAAASNAPGQRQRKF